MRLPMSRISKLKRPWVLGAMVALALFFVTSTLPWRDEQPLAASDVQVSVEQFGRYINEWSEPEGYFDSDNFISNETSYLHVIDQLQSRVKPDGVYLGVGPDQNFSYIVHTRPTLAIITDIRRQNMLQHLWFKALFARASNRAEFLSFLFSRPMPGLKQGASLQDMLTAIRTAPPNDRLFQENFSAIKTLLTQKYRLRLSADDLAKIEYVYQTFWEDGPDLRFSSIGRGNALNYPTFEEMLLETDRAGDQQGFLVSEESFQWLKNFQAQNRLIPIVGDFAGMQALRRVALFLNANGLAVSAFYTSNVEFYLFGRPDWARYIANVVALPVNEDSVIIRSYFGNSGPHPENVPGHRSTSLVRPMARFRDNARAGRMRTYWDVVRP